MKLFDDSSVAIVRRIVGEDIRLGVEEDLSHRPSR